MSGLASGIVSTRLFVNPLVNQLYSSRDSEYPGVGYPSCSRALARISRQYNDSNLYYADLGVPPWASDAEIKSALRAAFKRYHPDGSHPDAVKFLRFREIAEVLTNPEWKNRYDNTPSGELFIDSEIRARLADAGIPLEDIVTSFADEMPDGEVFYDYFSVDVDPFDCIKSQEWYESLVDTAPLINYTSSIRVMLCDAAAPDWLPRGKILLIPRWWKPCSANAFGLFSTFVRVA